MIRRTNRKKGLSVVEVMVVVAIIGIILSIAAQAWLRSRAQARAKICLENQSKMLDAVQSWALNTGSQADATPSYVDLIGPTLYLKRTPICPIGPTNVVIPAANGKPECPTHTLGHELGG